MKTDTAAFKVIQTGPIEVNTIFLTLGEDLYIIDPGGSPEELAEQAKKSGCRNYRILLTHAHCDHIAGIGELCKLLNVQSVYLHPDDVKLYNSPDNSLGPILRHPDDLVKTTWPLADSRIEVRHTPGHSPGGVIYYVPELKTAFVGDSIFEESIGRTDLWGGSEHALIESIRKEIFSLPGETTLVPGHGPFTEVDHEIQYNPYTGGR